MPPRPPAPVLPGTVLVVHHDDGLRNYLMARLRLNGVPVAEAADAAEALALLAAHPGLIAAVVTGARLGGTTVEAFASAVRAAGGCRVFLFTSGYDTESLPPGVQVFQKPQGLDGLLDAIRTLPPVS